MKNTTKGFASVLLTIGVIVLVVAGYFLYSRIGTQDDINKSVDNEKMQMVSDSDDPSVISQEFDETELNVDEFETELTVLESDIKGL